MGFNDITMDVDSYEELFANAFIKSEKPEKPDNFDKYNEEIKQRKEYIKAKREAFYKKNNLKEK